MRNLKAFLSAVLITTATFAATACSSKDSSSSTDIIMDEEKRTKLFEIAENEDLLKGEIENKKIKWLSNWDINPDVNSGKYTPPDLALFKEIYGGEIEYIACTKSDLLYDKLAKSISSGEGVDFFYGGNLDAFPRGALNDNNWFVPADDYIDFDSVLWKDVKAANDELLWGGKHYLAITQVTGSNVACIYNRKTIQEAGLDDPADLYRKGKWDWDAFEGMLEKFVGSDSNHYGIDGWWFEFGLINTIGVPAVGIEDGKLKSNVGDPAMERVQNWMYDLYQKGYVAVGEASGWNVFPQHIGEGSLLFYPVGLYELYYKPEQWKATYGEDAFFVPMPKDPKADAQYIPVGMEAYAFVNGGQNPEGVAKFLDCKRFVLINKEARSIADSTFIDDYGWTQEMLDMKDEMDRIAEEDPVFDLSKGVSKDCGELLDTELRKTTRGVPWNETYESIAPVVEKYIEDINNSISDQ
jgi:hypothetical protein